MLDQFRAQKIEWNRANNQIYDRVEANSGDSNGRTLFVQILNGGMVEDLTGAVLSLAWNKGTVQGLEAFDEVDAKKGQFRLFYPTGMLVNHGVLQASLVLVDVTGRIESKPFDIIVHKGTVDDEAVESDNKFTALTTALIRVSQVQAEFDGLYADKSLMMDTLKVEKSNEMDQLKAGKSTELDQLKADKTTELDQLYNDKNQALTGLETEFADKAEVLEQTYAPRLTGVESGLVDLESKSIVDSGSNANGNWVRFADGTMICTHRMFSASGITTPYGSLFRTDSTSWNFPQPFSDFPVMSATCQDTVAYSIAAMGSLGTYATNGTFSVINSESYSQPVLVGLTAIGRWK